MSEDFLFPPEFQDKVLALIIRDRTFRVSVKDFLKPYHFDEADSNLICSTVYKLHDKYSNLPSIDALKALLFRYRASRGTGDEITSKIDDLVELDFSDEEEFVRDQVTDFVRRQAYKYAILKGAEEVNEGRFDEFERLVKTASMIGRRDEGSSLVMRDIDNVLEEYVHLNRTENMIYTGFPNLDRLTRGSHKGDLNVIISDSGVGKTMFLVNVACHNLRQGKIVLYLTLELSRILLQVRHYCCLTGERSDELLSSPSRLARMRRGLRELAGTGEIIITEYKYDQCTINSVRSIIEDTERRVGKLPDLVIVDYATLMTPPLIIAASPSETLRNTFRALRGVGLEYNVPIWTAGQTGSAGSDREIVTPVYIAGAYQIKSECDMMLCASQTLQERGEGLMKIFVGKARNRDAMKLFKMRQDYSRMQMRDLGMCEVTEEQALSLGRGRRQTRRVQPSTQVQRSRFDVEGN